jgi:hypothetical protein
MKVLPVIESHQHEAPGALQPSAPLSAQKSVAIDALEIGHRFSVLPWLAAHSVEPSREEVFARSIASSLRELSPLRGRWAFLTRAEKSCRSWANQGPTVSLTKDRSKSGH